VPTKCKSHENPDGIVAKLAIIDRFAENTNLFDVAKSIIPY